ncbi:MAG: beta-ketoacyl synthase N-terminal-like domain-containing protein, partial [Thermoanaerobaculia bacterium]
MPDSPTSLSTLRRAPIAIVGVSALFPGSADAGGFWRDILAGRDLISEVPPSHWLPEDYFDPDPKAPDKTYAKRGAFLSEIDFDPLAFGIPPTIVPATDTSQLLALIVARQVLDDAAAGQFSKLDKSRISVILGVTSAQELIGESVSRLQRPVWVKALRESGIPEDQVEEICNRIAGHYVPWQESTFPGLLGNVVAGRIANRFDLGGANLVTDAACASALAALSMATNELRLGSSDMVIAGGVDTLNDIFMFMCFSKTPALSATGDCRPFSDRADGTLLGEGLGMVALKRLEDAERDGDRIYAVIRGIGASSDGRAKSVYAPVPEGQAKALGRAYEEAGYTPETVELVEAHGTATKAGDAAELEGLKLAFQNRSEDGAPEAAEDSGRRQWCALGSVKSQIGHTKAAAGVAGLFKAVMALHHKILPPTIKVERPNPALDLESSPFYLNTKARPWIGNGDHPRRAGVSSFGFGGSNYHIAVEEYLGTAPRPPRMRTAEEELVLVTAESAAELVERATEMANEAEPGRLEWLAADTQKRFTPAAYRLAVMARDEDDLRRKLAAAGQRVSDQPEAAFNAPGIYYGCGEHQGKVAFLFPGQGSQYPSMGASLAMTFDRAREVWDRSAALALDGAKKLHEVVFERSAWSDQERQEQLEELTATRWTQPAIGAVSLSMLALLKVAGVHAQCVAGHSYGELTALYAAGSFTEETLLELSRKRGELMEDATSIASAMTAVDMSSEELSARLEEWGHEVVIANHNAPRQVVLSGALTEIEAVENRLAAESVTYRRLPVAAAFHSPLLSEVAADFRADLDRREIAAPQIPVYSNSEAAPYPADPEGVRRVLAEQIARPVRFRELLEALAKSGVRTFIEVGPGSVLTNLVGRNLGDGYLAVSLDRKTT